MPKASAINYEHLLEKLSKQLSQLGPSTAQNLCSILKISQATFSRLISQAGNSILRLGKGSQTLYAQLRSGPGAKSHLSLLSLNEKGDVQKIASLYLIAPRGFYLKSYSKAFASRPYPNLPYFLEDLRPAGFLGRLIPRLYPALGFPDDIHLWTDEDCLLYFYELGWDLIGHFMIGEKSYHTYLENQTKRQDIIDGTNRRKIYPKLAELVLLAGIPGSSAAGEQPKFLSHIKIKSKITPVLVKFSPPIENTVSQRIADLLICEHLAHGVLKKHGKKAADSTLIRGGQRLFLEIERFDRIGLKGRKGLISLRALDLEFVGQLKSWSETAKSLLDQKIIQFEIYEDIVWLEVFGKLIANTDRHLGNISFYCDGEKILGLAPVYDMLPMLYAPQQNQLIERIFEVKAAQLDEQLVWMSALKAAKEFWKEIQQHSQISKAFKILAKQNEAKLALYL